MNISDQFLMLTRCYRLISYLNRSQPHLSTDSLTKFTGMFVQDFNSQNTHFGLTQRDQPPNIHSCSYYRKFQTCFQACIKIFSKIFTSTQYFIQAALSKWWKVIEAMSRNKVFIPFKGSYKNIRQETTVGITNCGALNFNHTCWFWDVCLHLHACSW